MAVLLMAVPPLPPLHDDETREAVAIAERIIFIDVVVVVVVVADDDDLMSTPVVAMNDRDIQSPCRPDYRTRFTFDFSLQPKPRGTSQSRV